MVSGRLGLLLEVYPTHRRLLYETAFQSGLRANELRNSTLAHLDVASRGLHLDAAWTKNRKSGFQPVPVSLVLRLQAFGESGEASALYATNLRRGGSKRPPPANPLLYVPSQPARTIRRDLEAAGIPIWTPSGKFDFHACRTAYVNLVFEYGDVSVKEAQDLARHSTAVLTLNVYGRTRQERLSGAEERIGQALVSEQKRAVFVHKMAVGAQREIATLKETEGCDSRDMAPAVGLEPTTWWLTATRSAS